jgi:hypothetical protein
MGPAAVLPVRMKPDVLAGIEYQNAAYARGEYLIAVTGHRPDKLGGYGPPTPLRRWVRRELRGTMQLLGGSFFQDPPLKPLAVISGMALGVDQDWAEIAVRLGVPFIAAVPFEGQERKWRPEQQKYYRELLAKAREVVVVSPGGYSIEAMHARNRWMVHACNALVSVWDGSPGGTGSCVNYATWEAGKGSWGGPHLRIDPRDYPQLVAQGLAE